MSTARPHKRLDAWKQAMDRVTAVYKVAASFPPDERYGLVNQMKRAAVSVPSNIAEGAGRQTNKEFIQFLHMAQGSLSELDTHIEIAARLTYISPEHQARLDAAIEDISRPLSGLIRSLEKQAVAR